MTFSSRSRQCLISFILLACISHPPAASAAEEWVNSATILRVLSAGDGRWGNCMVLLDKPASACGTPWFHFSCDGTYVSEERGRQSLSVALAAFLAGRTVDVLVDDTKRANNYCYAARIDVNP